jgi:O-antigen ligase
MGGTPIIHNSFMSVASELGIAGLILLLIIYVYFGKTALIDGRNIRDDYLRRTQISLGAIWIALIVNSFMYFKFFEDPKVWLVAGLIVSTNKILVSEHGSIKE